jgi:hypothetical protein
MTVPKHAAADLAFPPLSQHQACRTQLTNGGFFALFFAFGIDLFGSGGSHNAF